jgi:hypothetical protein
MVSPDMKQAALTTASLPEPRDFPGVTEPEPTVQRSHAGITPATGLSLSPRTGAM